MPPTAVCERSADLKELTGSVGVSFHFLVTIALTRMVPFALPVVSRLPESPESRTERFLHIECERSYPRDGGQLARPQLAVHPPEPGTHAEHIA